MNTIRSRQYVATGLLLLLSFADAVVAAPNLRVAPLGYQVVQVQAVAGQSRTYDVTSRAGVTNSGDAATDVTARLTSSTPAVIVTDGEVRFGNVPRTSAYRPVISRDTFTLRITLPRVMSWPELLAFVRSVHSGLRWQVSCANCGQANRPPVANAGADQSAYVQQLVRFDGSASSDPDGDALTFEWKLLQRPAGSAAALADMGGVAPTLTPDREGDYLVQLIVRDSGSLASGPDTVVISTLNSAPVANAGADQTAFLSQLVQLDGSGSSDVDGDSLTYAWQLVQRPAGSAAALDDTELVNPTLVPDVAGQYVVELVVDDGTVSSVPDTTVISTANSRPVANAGADQSARVGDAAALDGSGSSDVDGDALTYRWSLAARPANSTTALQGEGTPAPTLPIDQPGTYVAQLIVNDGAADSDADTVSVSTLNTAPVAVAGPDQTVHFGATVQLNGVASIDADGDPLSFTWSLLSVPSNSVAALSDPMAIAPSFIADRPGTYVVQLIVNDGIVNSASGSLTVTANNTAPVARDDSASTAAGTPVTVNVLANDSDADAEDTLRVAAVTPPANGTATFTANEVAYTPNADFSGSDAFTYRITDGAEAATANVTVSVEGENAAPIAHAGNDVSGIVGSSIALDGSGSIDADGDSLRFAWTIVSGAATASLSGADTATPNLTATQAGSYTVQLIVNDTVADSAPDFVTVSVSPAPSADTDNDGLSDDDERRIGTDPLNPDTDGDGYRDGDEVAAGTSPLDSESHPMFALAILPFDANAFAGSARRIPVRITRDVGFTAPVTIEIVNPPAPFTVPIVELGDGVDDSTLRVQVAGNATPGPQTLTIRAAGGGVVRTLMQTLHLLDAQPASERLIAQALADGTIDSLTALRYRVFARYGDPRLPEQFRGSGSHGETRGLMQEVLTSIATAPADIRDELLPFTYRPAHPESWYSRLFAGAAANGGAAGTIAPPGGMASRSMNITSVTTNSILFLPAQCGAGETPPDGWISRSSDRGYTFRVWAKCEIGTNPDNIASQIAKVVGLFDKIWPSMTADFGDPVLDRGPGDPPNALDGKGDASIDIYILNDAQLVSRPGCPCAVDGNDYGETDSSPAPGNEGLQAQKSAFIMLRQSVITTPGLFHTTAIHELSHVLQYARNAVLTDTDWWFLEASSRWAEAHYDRSLSPWVPWGPARAAYREVYRDWYEEGFQTRSSAVSLFDEERADEALIYPYFMEQHGMPPASIWRDQLPNVASSSAANARIDGVFPFREQFRVFAVRNINIALEPGDPIQPKFNALDAAEFPDGAEPQVEEVSIDGPITTGNSVFLLAPVGIKYLRFINDDPRIRQIEFDLRALEGIRAARGIDVDVLLKIRNQSWVRQDWNATSQRKFCLDDPPDDLEEILFVVSSHLPLDVGTQNETAVIRRTATLTPCPVRWRGESRSEWRLLGPPFTRVQATATLNWDPDPVVPELGDTQFFVPHGSITIDRYTILDCVFSVAPRTITVSGRDFGDMSIEYSLEPAVVSYRAGAAIITTTTNCNGQSFPDVVNTLFGASAPVPLNEAEDHIQYSDQFELGGVEYTVTGDYRREFIRN